jgi:peptidyl-prolyl cis-trans isomerase C
MSVAGPEPDAASRPSAMKRWLHEPLVHFLAIGLVLFAVFRVINPEKQDSSNRIEMTEADLRQMTIAWMAQWRRPPTPEEMRGLVDAKIREEILYREALALGLEKGDTIVMRRLAQKMEFLAEDVSTVREPPADELKQWFEKNRERFAVAPRMSFRHLYFSFDQRHEGAREDAEQALATLAGKSAEASEVIKLGDPFMFQDYYGDRLPEQVGSVFGMKFAETLFELKPGAWQGPIESGFGWHLIWIDSTTPGRVPAYEEVEGMVKSEWTTEERAESKRKTYETMRARYQIVTPEAPEK